MGTTTSPQQQNPQTGADKDPCEVRLAIKARLFILKKSRFSYVYITNLSIVKSLPHMSAKLNAIKRQNWHLTRIFCICVLNLFKCWEMNGNNISS